jgi:large conductance mechanosensitive channel
VKILQEFKAFAMRGNVIDLAVGLIMGAAFTKIVSSLVSDVIMPPIGYAIGGVKFTDLNVLIGTKLVEEKNAGGEVVQTLQKVTLNYGSFLQTVFDFLIVAFCVFMLNKLMNWLWKKKEEAPKPAELSTQEKLLVEIRDLLKSQQGAA